MKDQDPQDYARSVVPTEGKRVNVMHSDAGHLFQGYLARQ